jgi:hypothetical protein
MKSVWAPIIFSFIVIIFSVFIIKSGPTPLPLIANPPTGGPTPVSSAIPSIAEPTVSNKPTWPTPTTDPEYAKTYAKCGELPLLPDYSPTRFRGEYSPKMWSPGCRFIGWSATIKNSFGPWALSPYEGLFIYDLKTKVVTRIYTPASETDTVRFIKWRDDTHLIFHLDLISSDYLYNMSIKTYSRL